MVLLRLLGGANLEDESGPLSGRATQRRRLALLAILAIEHPRPVSRDKLVAWLWPEHDTERARHLLRDSLYLLRGTLGDGTISTVGDEVRLDPQRLRCDLWEFDEALRQNRLEDAVQAYGGPLLDGVHLPDLGELERWFEVERARIAQRQAAALEALAEAAESRAEFGVAAAWWRRLATRDPYDGRVALRLMRALEAVGDRAGALRHARVHAELLRSEFDTQPDADVTAFAERLRLEPSPRVAAEPAAAAPRMPTAVAAAPPVADVASRASRRTRPARGWVPAGVAALLLTLAVAWTYGVSRARETTAAARSVAVLPFVDMSPDRATGYFSDGLTEQIITALSRIPALRVAARTSSFALRDDKLDVRVVGDTLGVEAVLEGSVRREGEKLRVTAQLIDARTGYHLWSGEYDRRITDVIAVQDEIADDIATALELRLPARATPSRGRRPPDPRAYDLYLRALNLRDDMSLDAMRAASELLDRAITIQPDFALAWAEKANVMGPRINYGDVPREKGVAEMRTAVSRALELDQNLGEAHVALGILRTFYEWDWKGGEQAFRRAVELNPSDPHAWHNLANYLNVAGRREEAVSVRLRGIALDPLNARMRGILALELSGVGRHDEAFAEYERARRGGPMNPNVLGIGPGLPLGAVVYGAHGRMDLAVEELVRIATLRGASSAEVDAIRAAFAEDGMPGVWRSWLSMDLRLSGGSINALRRAILHASSGETEQGLDWLERAHAERNPGIIFVQGWASDLPELRSSPRYARILREMRLPVK